MLDNFEWPQPQDEADEKLLHNIRKHGCHIMSISGDERAPPFVFSIGLFVNYEHPEIIIFGREPRNAAGIINVVCADAAAGKKYAAGDVSTDILVQGRVGFAEVPLLLYPNYLGTAIWFYDKSPRIFPYLQLLWPDANDLLPGETGYDDSLRKYQPILKSLS